MHRRDLMLAAAAASLATPLMVPHAGRAQEFPTRPIRIVVGFPPGGGSDLVARPIAQRLGELLGQSVFVENRAGANATLALDFVAKQPPDGHVIAHVNSAVIAINPLLYKNLPFDARRDFAPVATVTIGGLMVFVPAELPVSDLRGLVELIRARPGQLNYGSAGPGSIVHLAYELFVRQNRLDLVNVQYRGSAPALSDMLAGPVHLMIDGINVGKPHVDSGKLKALAFLGPSRSPAMPHIPTSAEAGFPNLQVTGWQGFVAPARTPPAVLDRLQEAMRAAVTDPAMKALFLTQGVVAEFQDRATMARLIQGEFDKWDPIIRELGLTLE
jgi:tripartite-type tricarboxylate transporter receptor subunit TctC